MRVAVFSDVHGDLPALHAVLGAVDRHHPVHLVVAAGDHCHGGAQPAEVWDVLQAIGSVCLLGNEDARIWNGRRATGGESRWTAANDASLPWYRDVLGPARLAAMHALPRSLRLSLAPGQDLLIVHANIHGPYGWAFNVASSDTALARLYEGANARVVCCGHYHQAAMREWGGMTLVNVASVSLPVDGQSLAGYTLLDWDGTVWHVAQYRVPYNSIGA